MPVLGISSLAFSHRPPLWLRCLALAAVPLIVASSPAKVASLDPSAAPSATTPASPKVPARKARETSLPAPCPRGRDGDRRYDLCAQWKAADAAAEATVWAGWSVAIAGFGAFVALATLIAAGFAAKYAREAAHYTKLGAAEAERSASAAVDGIGLSYAAISQSSKQFLTANRPWLAIENVKFKYAENPHRDTPSAIVGVASYDLVNYGNMPALAVDSLAQLAYWDSIDGPPAIDVASLLARASHRGSVIFPSERRAKGRLDGHGAMGLGFADGRTGFSGGLRVYVTYRGNDGTPYLTAQDLEVGLAGSSENRIMHIMFEQLTSELVQAEVIEVRGATAVV